MIRKPRAQGILDFLLTFIAILGLFIGIVRIWTWFHANYAKRQVAFQTSRLFAGNVTTYEGRTTPVQVVPSPTCPSGDCYKPIDLTPEWIFRGDTGNEKVSLLAAPPQINFPLAQETCRTNCQNDTQCQSAEVFEECPCYVQCMCESYQIGNITATYDNVITQNAAAIPKLQDVAKGLREAADSCDDPWEGCWWGGGFGKTAKELRNAASDINKQVIDIQLQNIKLQTTIAKMKSCCDIKVNPTIRQQDVCIANAQQESCPDIANAYAQLWGERRSSVQTEITKLKGLQTAALAWIPPCDAKAESQQTKDICTLACTFVPPLPPLPQDQYVICFSNCKEGIRNQCCQGFTDPNFPVASGRNCRQPAGGCDCRGCPKCGLEAFANSTLANEINRKQGQVDSLTTAITNVNSCCAGGGLPCINAAVQTAANGYND